ncbi:MAG: thiamine diphosphokinase [Spirochaetota bacterium]
MDMQKTAIIGNGSIDDYSWLKGELARYATIIAADGGANHLHRIGMKPDVLVGDMDSIKVTVDPDTLIVSYPVDKDASDMDLSIQYALSMSPAPIDIFGALGGRADHQFCNIMVLANYNAVITVKTENASIRCVHESAAAQIHREGRGVNTVTIMPLDITATVTTRGLAYSLRGDVLARGSKGLSNRMNEDTASVRVESGNIILFHSW